MGYALMLKNVNFSSNKLDTIEFNDNVPCTGITLNKSTLSFNSLSVVDSLVASVQPMDATDPILWTVSDTDVVTVSDGLVTPVGLGQAVITASCGNYSASCSVNVDNVVPAYIAITGYGPYKRSPGAPAATTGQKTQQGNGQYIMIANDDPVNLYPIESNSEKDTSPYRFVPIIIPKGTSKIVITANDDIRTRVLYFDSTKQETTFNVGAYCLSGFTNESTDQSSRVPTPIEYEIPTNLDGLDSCCIGVIRAIGSQMPGHIDVSDEVSIMFTM